jgi:hypothetical protein
MHGLRLSLLIAAGVAVAAGGASALLRPARHHNDTTLVERTGA